jgi:ribosomal protein S18 acetylase RimI-like enzyme
MPPDGIRGPEPAAIDEIDQINRIFSEAFTDRYQRDGLTGVRVPLLNPAIWRFAIADAADGAVVWRDRVGGIVAFNMIHRSGTEGWMGPLAVRPDHQGEGLGGVIVREGIRRLEAAGARVIGLETMPRTVENIGFYSRLGFRPGHLTVSLTRELEDASVSAGALLSRADRAAGVASCRALTEWCSPGTDYTRDIELTLEHELGDVTMLTDEGTVTGFALWQVAPLALGRPREEVRVLKLVARDVGVMRRLVQAVECAGRNAKARRVSIRCQTVFREAYGALLAEGYAVHWTDLRMTLEGKEEVHPRGDGVVFSNWEI